jgi:hypothetical protein
MASPGGADLHTPAPLGLSSSTKHSQAEVNYRAAAEGPGSCGACRYFQGGSCKIVKGTIRASMTCDLYSPQTEKATETFRGVGGRLTRGRGPGGKRTHGQSYYTGGAHGPSILNPAVYDALRRKGHDKKSAAAISNGALNKRTKGGKWYAKGKHSSGRAKMTEPFSVQSFSEFLEEFFDKKAYMASYNAKRHAPGRMSVGSANQARHRLTKAGQKQVRQGAKAKRALPGLLKNRQNQKGRVKALEAITKIRSARSMMAQSASIGKGQPARKAAMKLSGKAALSSMRSGRMKDGLRANPRKGVNPMYDKSQYHAEPFNEFLERFFDKKAYMAAYNARRHGAGRAAKAAAGGAVPGAGHALGSIHRGNVNRVAKNRRQAGAKRVKRAAAKNPGDSFYKKARASFEKERAAGAFKLSPSAAKGRVRKNGILVPKGYKDSY